MIRIIRDYVIIFFVLGMIGLLLFNFILMPLYVNWRDEVRVPNLLYTNITEAEKRLDNRQLSLVIKDTVYHAESLTGTILEQYPDPGTMVKEDRKIQLTVAIPPVGQNLPDFVASTERKVRIAIQHLGLRLVNIFQDSSDIYHKGVIMAQSVPPEATIIPGDTISYTVSLGMRNVVKFVPDLLNMDQSQAIDAILSAGFSLGDISYQQDSVLLMETVVAQSYTAGRSFPVASQIKIDLVVTTE
jgi:eukaryotic-like serine/threonine-protein kinase